MIVLFHFLYYLTKYYVNFFTNVPNENVSLDLQSMCKPKNLLDAEENLKFDPPVYKQRYGEIQLMLLENKWKEDIRKIVDFGCAEFKLFHFINRLYRITDILAVDIDEELLRENLFRIQPLVADYICRRTYPFNIHVLRGSISDPDQHLIGVDAVIGIEIIEHLYPDTLEGLPYNIFGFIKPKLAVFTTPNADFNILFPNFKGVRHYDHKFEWSREQFEMWCDNIVCRFPNYSVSFKGIGEGPNGTKHLGCCSQMAIFVQNVQSDFEFNDKSSFGICTYHSKSTTFSSEEQDNGHYKLIECVEYPFEQDERTVQQKIYDELQYRMRLMGRINGRFYNCENSRIEIPVIDLIYNQYTHFTSIPEACSILTEAGHPIEECVICDKLETCVIYEPHMESSNSTRSSDTTDDFEFNKHFGDWNAGSDRESDWSIESEDQQNPWVNSFSKRKNQSEAYTNAQDIIYNIVTNLERRDSSSIASGITASLDDNPSNSYESSEINDSGYSLSVSNLTSSKNSNSDSGGLDILNEYNQSVKQADKSTSKTILQHNVEIPSGSKSNVPKSKTGNIYPNGISSKNIRKDITAAPKEKDNLKFKAVPDKNQKVDDINVNADAVDMIPQQCAGLQDVHEEVENGDLANNNRDMEGNNYPNAAADVHNENDNENVVLQNNEHDGHVRNDDVENRNEVMDDLIAAEVEPAPIQNDHIELDVNFSSREAIFDPNSQVDLLEDYDISAEGEQIVTQNNDSSDIVLIELEPVENNEAGQVLPINSDPFPNWLLNLLGPRLPDEVDTHDEPHFYCQGDGLGVHPSFVEEDFEDESSTDSSETSTSEARSNDEAEADPSLSEVDAGSLPEDVTESPEPLHIINLPVSINNEQPTEAAAGPSSGNEGTVGLVVNKNHSVPVKTNLSQEPEMNSNNK